MLRLGRDNSLIALSLLLWGLGSGLYQYVWPLYIKSLGANSVEIGLALALGSVVAILIFIPGGMVADRYSRKKNMIVSWVLGSLAALVYAFSQDWRQLLFGIALMSASQFCDPALNAYIAEAGEGRDLGLTFTLVFAAIWLGMAISPPIGGLIMQGGDMRPLFYAAFLLYSLSTVAICLIQDQPRAPVRGTAKQGYGGILLDSRMAALFAFFFAIYVAGFLGRSFAAVYLEEVSGLSRPLIGSLGTMLSLGSVFLTLAIGALSTRFGVVWALLVAEGLLMAGHSIFLQFAGVIPAATAYFLWGSNSPFSTLSRGVLGREFKAESAGRGFAIQSIVMSLATMVAPYATGWLYSLRPDLPYITALMLLPFLMAATAGLRQYGLKEVVKT